jgi:hypothetical protein
MPAIVAAASKLGMIVHLPESNHKDKTISKMAKIYKKTFWGTIWNTKEGTKHNKLSGSISIPIAA